MGLVIVLTLPARLVPLPQTSFPLLGCEGRQSRLLVLRGSCPGISFFPLSFFRPISFIFNSFRDTQHANVSSVTILHHTFCLI